MEYCLETLKTKINDYLNGGLKKKDLGRWGREAYYDLLRGGYTDKDKIIIYPFLKTVSQIDLEIDDMKDIYPTTQEDIESIRAIIMGIKPYYFQMVVSVPKSIYKNEGVLLDSDKYEKFKIVKIKLESYIENKSVRNEMFEYVREIAKIENSNRTILDMLQEQIIYSFYSLFDIEEGELIPQFGLYPQKQNSNLGLLKLKEYLECFLGEKNFLVNVSYVGGSNNLSIVV